MHTRRIALILSGVFLLNLAVSLARFWLFAETDSSGMFADAFHAASDACGSLILLLGLWLSSRPPDADHPHGHAFYEKLAITIIAVFIGCAALFAGWESLKRLLSGDYPSFSGLALLFFCATILVSLAITRVEHTFGHRYHSNSLHADAQHTAADVLTSLAVVIGFSASAIGIPWLDPLAAGMVIFFILRLSRNMFLETWREDS